MPLSVLLGFEFEGFSDIDALTLEAKLRSRSHLLQSQYPITNRGLIRSGFDHASPKEFTIGKDMSYKAQVGSKFSNEVEFTTPASNRQAAIDMSAWLLKGIGKHCTTSQKTALHIHVSIRIPNSVRFKPEMELPFSIDQIRNLVKLVLFCEEPFCEILRDPSPYCMSNRNNCLLRECKTLEDCYRKIDGCGSIYAVYLLMNAYIDNDEGHVGTDRSFLVNFARLFTYWDWEYRGHVGTFNEERVRWWATVVAKQSAFALAYPGSISVALKKTSHSLKGIGELLGVVCELEAMYKMRHLRNGPNTNMHRY